MAQIGRNFYKAALKRASRDLAKITGAPPPNLDSIVAMERFLSGPLSGMEEVKRAAQGLDRRTPAQRQKFIESELGTKGGGAGRLVRRVTPAAQGRNLLGAALGAQRGAVQPPIVTTTPTGPNPTPDPAGFARQGVGATVTTPVVAGEFGSLETLDDLFGKFREVNTKGSEDDFIRAIAGGNKSLKDRVITAVSEPRVGDTRSIRAAVAAQTGVSISAKQVAGFVGPAARTTPNLALNAARIGEIGAAAGGSTVIRFQLRRSLLDPVRRGLPQGERAEAIREIRREKIERRGRTKEQIERSRTTIRKRIKSQSRQFLRQTVRGIVPKGVQPSTVRRLTKRLGTVGRGLKGGLIGGIGFGLLETLIRAKELRQEPDPVPSERDIVRKLQLQELITRRMQRLEREPNAAMLLNAIADGPIIPHTPFETPLGSGKSSDELLQTKRNIVSQIPGVDENTRLAGLSAGIRSTMLTDPESPAPGEFPDFLNDSLTVGVA